MNVTFRPVAKADLAWLNEIVNDSQVAHYLSVIPPVPMKSTRDHFIGCRRNRSLDTIIMERLQG